MGLLRFDWLRLWLGLELVEVDWTGDCLSEDDVDVVCAGDDDDEDDDVCVVTVAVAAAAAAAGRWEEEEEDDFFTLGWSGCCRFVSLLSMLLAWKDFFSNFGLVSGGVDVCMALFGRLGMAPWLRSNDRVGNVCKNKIHASLQIKNHKHNYVKLT